MCWWYAYYSTHNRTDKKLNILNSEKFVVEKIDGTKLNITDGDCKIIINIADFNKFFYLHRV